MARIFVIDNQEHIRGWYTHELMKQGHEVISAASGCNLLNKVEMFQADLIILDIDLIDREGMEKLRQIRESYAESPVIIWTASDYSGFQGKGIAPDYHVIKSYDLTELNAKIQSALDSKASFRN